MAVFLDLLQRLIPLYVLVLCGFVAGRYLRIAKENVASLLIYLIVPAVVLTSIAQTELSLAYLSVPFLFFALCSGICLVFLRIGRRLWKGPAGNLLGFAAGHGNSGYFGLPVAMLLFGDQIVGLSMLFFMGFTFYENTMGFYVTARGHHTARESLVRVLKVPTLYAFGLGLVFNVLGIRFTGAFGELAASFRGAYSVLGMMMIGLGASGITRFRFDLKFVSATLVAKFLVWPLVVLGIIWVDGRFLHIYDAQVHSMMILMASVPIAANVVAISAVLKVEPEKAAVAVLLSTVFALFFIPFMAIFFISP